MYMQKLLSNLDSYTFIKQRYGWGYSIPPVLPFVYSSYNRVV